MLYIKPALTFSDQVALLQARGLIIENYAYAEETLSHISYYRLSAYFRPFRQAGTERFAGATLTFEHTRFLGHIKELEKNSNDKFVGHFQRKYSEEVYLPIWMATELMSFGFLSRIYKALTVDLQKEIAEDIGVPQSVLRTWLHTLSYVRNICAHHGRLWSRELAISPKYPNNSGRWPYLGLDPKRTYGAIVLICDLLEKVSDDTKCKEALRGQLSLANPMELAGMWVPKNWRGFAPWQAAPAKQGS